MPAVRVRAGDVRPFDLVRGSQPPAPVTLVEQNDSQVVITDRAGRTHTCSADDMLSVIRPEVDRVALLEALFVAECHRADVNADGNRHAERAQAATDSREALAALGWTPQPIGGAR